MLSATLNVARGCVVSRVRSVVGAAALAALVLLAAGISAASAAGPQSCPPRSLVTPFSAWGDQGSYFALPNGGFESGTSGWTLGDGAWVVPGNETSFIGSRGDRSSLLLRGGASAQSDPACFQVTDQSIRLMVKSPFGRGAQLKIDAYVLTQTAGGVNIRTVSTQVDAQPGGWKPSQPVTFSLGQSQMLAPTATVRFTFTALGGPWQIDDIYVDPFKSN